MRSGRRSDSPADENETSLRGLISAAWGNYIDSSKLVFLANFETKCPSCGSKGFLIQEYLYDMPRVGKTIITVGKCPKCGYTYRDIRLAESRGPQRLVIRVSSERDLNRIVLKASSASLRIPELGLEMTPGPAAEGFITTIEGILLRFLEVLSVVCRDAEGEQAKNCERVRRDIESALRGEKEFTVVIEDPEGVSAILD